MIFRPIDENQPTEASAETENGGFPAQNQPSTCFSSPQKSRRGTPFVVQKDRNRMHSSHWACAGIGIKKCAPKAIVCTRRS
jgi:hypothetical protein